MIVDLSSLLNKSGRYPIPMHESIQNAEKPSLKLAEPARVHNSEQRCMCDVEALLQK